LAVLLIGGSLLVVSARAHGHESLASYRGIVTAVTDHEVTVRSHGGQKRTFPRNPKTMVLKDQQPVGWSDIPLRSYVIVRFTNRRGEPVVRRITIGRENVRGKVERVTTELILIATTDGRHIRISVDADTRYTASSSPSTRGALAEIRPGMHLVASGAWDSTDAFDAASVLYR